MERVYQNASIVISVGLVGVINSPIAVKMNKEEKSKVVTSTEENPYFAKQLHKAPTFSTPVRRTTISAEAVNDLLARGSETQCPWFIRSKSDKNRWDSMDDEARIQSYVSNFADGAEYSFEILS